MAKNAYYNAEYNAVMSKPGVADMIIGLREDGESESGIATKLGIHYDTMRKWKKSKPEFRAILERGTSKLRSTVSSKFYQKALGLCVTKTTTKIIVKDKKGNVITDTVKQTITEIP